MRMETQRDGVVALLSLLQMHCQTIVGNFKFTQLLFIFRHHLLHMLEFSISALKLFKIARRSF